MSGTLRRYVILQVPGVALAAIVAFLLWAGAVVSGSVALVALCAWVAKDAILYPFVKSAYDAAVPCGADRLVGETGTAVTAIDPEGRVRIRGELWNARLKDGGRLAAGCTIAVVSSDGLTLLVRATDGARPDQG